MPRLFFATILVLFNSTAFAQFKQPDPIYQFVCADPGKPPVCTMRCWSGGEKVEFKYNELIVFQYKEHPRRIWFTADKKPGILGDDATCDFGHYPSVPIGRPSSGSAIPPISLDGLKPGTACVGEACYGPKK